MTIGEGIFSRIKNETNDNEAPEVKIKELAPAKATLDEVVDEIK
jgi:hypothetical protein